MEMGVKRDRVKSTILFYCLYIVSEFDIVKHRVSVLSLFTTKIKGLILLLSLFG